MAHATTPQTEVELSQVDIAPNSDTIIDKDITLTTNANHLQPQTISDDKALNQSLGNDSSTLISLINVELGINVEGVQKLPNY